MGQVARILTEAEKAEVETLAAVLSSAQIADYLGMARRTFYDAMERDDDLAARYKKGRARAVGAVAQSLITKARSGNITAMIFYLKTQGGWRETLEVESRTEEASKDASQAAFTRLATYLEGAGSRMVAHQGREDQTVDATPVRDT